MKATFTTLTTLILASVCAVAMAQPGVQRDDDQDSARRALPGQQAQPGQQARPGQQRALPGQQQASTTRGEQGSDQQLTQFFAGKLLLMNESTIKMSQKAEQKLSSDETKEFAKSLVDSHQKLNQKLRQQVSNLGPIASLGESEEEHTTGFRGPDAATQNETFQQQAQNPRRDARGATPGETQSQFTRPGQGGDDKLVHKILKIERKAASNYVNHANQMLDRYEGQDYDMGYLGFQIGCHTWALAELKAIDSVGDQQFQQVVDEAKSEVEQHLKKAKQLSKKLEDDRRQGLSQTDFGRARN